MDPLSAGTWLLGSTAKKLSDDMLAKSGGRIKRAIVGSEHQQALERSVRAGVALLVASTASEDPEKQNVLDTIFRSFFHQEDVAEELAQLLRGRPLDIDELRQLFDEAGYDAETLPGINFEEALLLFQAGFVEAIEEEDALQEIIKVTELKQQSRMQRQMVDLLNVLVVEMQAKPPNAIHLFPGQIQIQGVDRLFNLLDKKSTREHETVETLYLNTLVDRCNIVDLSPLQESGKLPGMGGEEDHVKLADVFTQLHLEGITRNPSESVHEALFSSSAQKDRVQSEQERVPVLASEAIAAADRLVVLGEPGGGKSTLVNHLATQFALRRLGQDTPQEAMPGWPSDAVPLPVIIVLRRFAAWIDASTKRGTPGLVWQYLKERQMAHEYGTAEAFDRIKYILTQEGGIVFFDGLDEVTATDEAEKRKIIKEAIESFAAPLVKCKVVVTCRTYAYTEREQWRLPAAVFPVVTLGLFSTTQIRSFTAAWYQVVGKARGWDQEKINVEAEVLSSAIEGLHYLQELAQYPLLLTLMAQVHGRDGYLPQDRADLYDKAVKLLLMNWENYMVRDVRGGLTVMPGLVMKLNIREDTLRNVLAKVAYLAHKQQATQSNRAERAADIDRHLLRDELERVLDSPNDAKEALEYIQQRAGLLIARDTDTYSFPHRTFQEYLAALHVLNDSEFDQLLAMHLEEDLEWWREVFLLAAGASSAIPRNVADIVDAILPEEPTPQPGARFRFVILAGRALWEAGFKRTALSNGSSKNRFAKLFSRVQESLLAGLQAQDAMSPSDRAEAGTLLGRLGDPRSEVVDPLYMTFLRIPAGPFTMGSSDQVIKSMAKYYHQNWNENEGPQHQVDLAYTYWCARHPVTVAQVRAYVEDTGVRLGHHKALQGPDNHPVVYISWDEVLSFCAWLTEKYQATAKHRLAQDDLDVEERMLWEALRGRQLVAMLPSEEEWEKAARGVEDDRTYPWGNDWDRERCNNWELGIHTTSAVGCFIGREDQPCDLVGNVWEWSRSVFDKERYRGRKKVQITEPEEMIEEAGSRVIRGGSFDMTQSDCRCAVRGDNVPDFRGSTMWDFVFFCSLRLRRRRIPDPWSPWIPGSLGMMQCASVGARNGKWWSVAFVSSV